ncbi:MAG: IclR family transcriptional regulator [Hyphomicrobiales bacterium]|nr:IclR family transcriptional regulator [Hyphomicrobiales bacterium]
MSDTVSGDGTVGKALDVLDQVAGFDRPVRFAELMTVSPYPKATLYRLLRSLTNQGMLQFDTDQQTYAPGLRLVRLAHAAWRHSSLSPVARPHLDDLSKRIEITVHLAQLDNGQVLYVDKRNAADRVQMFSEAGKVGPAYCTGIGKVMLAYLPEPELERALRQQAFHRYTPNTITTEKKLRAELATIRACGYGFDREEHEPGIICVAVPILLSRRRQIGALSATSTVQRTDLTALESMAPDLQENANRIAEDARNWRFPDNGNLGVEN